MWAGRAGGAVVVSPAGENRVEVRCGAYRYLYDGNGSHQTYAMAGLTDESQAGGFVVGYAHPLYRGPHLRWVGWLEGRLLHAGYVWRTEALATGGRVGAFRATLDTSGEAWRHFYDAQVTYVFFEGLPGVVLMDICSIQNRPETGVPPGAADLCVASFEKGQQRYNGIRFYPACAGGEGMFTSNGVTAEAGWYYSPRKVPPGSLPPDTKDTVLPGALRRGLFVSQLDGGNDWAVAPPHGWIVRKHQFFGVYSNSNADYTANCVALALPRTTKGRGDRVHNQVLWFEGQCLGSWERIFALDAAFNGRYLVEEVDQEDGREVRVTEAAGIERRPQIVVLDGKYRGMESSRPIFRGEPTVVLVPEVGAHQTVTLGTLQ